HARGALVPRQLFEHAAPERGTIESAPQGGKPPPAPAGAPSEHAEERSHGEQRRGGERRRLCELAQACDLSDRVLMRAERILQPLEQPEHPDEPVSAKPAQRLES